MAGMSRKNARKFGQGLRGILYGYGKLGPTTKATLYVGGTTGLNTSQIPEGRKIPKKTLIGVVVGSRVEQIGPAAGATATITEGRYKGQPERSFKIEFFHDGSEPNVTAFKRNISKLAQKVATRLAQREVYVELTTDGRRTTTYTASPEAAPSPLKSDVFCDWVRKHSRNAQRNPNDPCYRATKPRRKKRQ